MKTILFCCAIAFLLGLITPTSKKEVSAGLNKALAVLYKIEVHIEETRDTMRQ